MRISTLAVAAVVCVAAQMSCAKAAGLDVESAKQLLEARLLKLRPEGYTERQVLFQSVKLIDARGGSFRYRMTVKVRDYGPGYPKNRFYGATCVGTLEDEEFMFVAQTGGWAVEGRMTPSMANNKCVNNPAEGASSMPLASVAGTRAGTGQIPAAPAPVRSGGMVEGSYECWAYNRARLMLNFTVKAGGKYLDSEGKPGSFSVDPTNSRVTFHGGLLDGGIPAKMSAMYYEPKGKPTLSIRNAEGSEVTFCENVK